MKKIPYLHIVLFFATFVTTLIAGAVYQKGINILKEPVRIFEGLPFSLTLMTILLCHELSHYLASKRHHTEATLPYFIPAPITLIGTFGAFIKMKSPIETRKALIDIGASGPIVGFVVSVIACIVGLRMSEVVQVQRIEAGIGLGDSLLFSFLSRVVLGVAPDNYDILLHPVAFAGWIGLFVTSLNLMPIGQLDGGHIAFAVLGPRQRYVSILLVILLSILGLSALLGSSGWEGWAFWALLMLILGINHPPVVQWEVPLDPKRRFIGLLSLIIFIVTFIPSPFTLME